MKAHKFVYVIRTKLPEEKVDIEQYILPGKQVRRIVAKLLYELILNGYDCVMADKAHWWIYELTGNFRIILLDELGISDSSVELEMYRCLKGHMLVLILVSSGDLKLKDNVSKVESALKQTFSLTFQATHYKHKPLWNFYLATEEFYEILDDICRTYPICEYNVTMTGESVRVNLKKAVSYLVSGKLPKTIWNFVVSRFTCSNWFAGEIRFLDVASCGNGVLVMFHNVSEGAYYIVRVSEYSMWGGVRAKSLHELLMNIDKLLSTGPRKLSYLGGLDAVIALKRFRDTVRRLLKLQKSKEPYNGVVHEKWRRLLLKELELYRESFR